MFRLLLFFEDQLWQVEQVQKTKMLWLMAMMMTMRVMAMLNLMIWSGKMNQRSTDGAW